MTDNTRQAQKQAMLLGSFLGDAFVLGAHWIYDVKKIEAHFGDYTAPHEPLPGTWHKGKHLGDYTHYGDQAYLLNEYLQHQGSYSNDGFREVWRSFMRQYQGYMDAASKTSLNAFASNRSEGSDSDELGGAARIAPVIYRVSSPAEALDAAIRQSLLTHNSEPSQLATELFTRVVLAVLDSDTASLADILGQCLLDMRQAGQNTALLEKYLERASTVAGRPAAAIAETLGQSCHAQHAIPVIMAVLLSASGYRDALPLNARIGGDSATRGMILGAILGARNGMAGLPPEWLAVVKRPPTL